MSTAHNLGTEGVSSSIILGFQTENEICIEFVMIPETKYEDWKKDELRMKLQDVKDFITQ